MSRAVISIKSLGIEGYLDRLYADKGGADRFKKRLEWPNPALAQEYQVTRQTIARWKDLLKEGKK